MVNYLLTIETAIGIKSVETNKNSFKSSNESPIGKNTRLDNDHCDSFDSLRA